MEHLKIQATDRSPEVDFDFENLRFHLRGESYPEDVTAFYAPITAQLTDCLADAGVRGVEFNFELIYFNSSSAKVIMSIFDQLEEAAENGAQVTVNWIYDVEDETMAELGEEFGEDLVHVTFKMNVMNQ